MLYTNNFKKLLKYYKTKQTHNANIKTLQKMFAQSIDTVKLCIYTKHIVYDGSEAELFGENNSAFFANK